MIIMIIIIIVLWSWLLLLCIVAAAVVDGNNSNNVIVYLAFGLEVVVGQQQGDGGTETAMKATRRESFDSFASHWSVPRTAKVWWKLNTKNSNNSRSSCRFVQNWPSIDQKKKKKETTTNSTLCCGFRLQIEAAKFHVPKSGRKRRSSRLFTDRLHTTRYYLSASWFFCSFLAGHHSTDESAPSREAIW